jgi:hypothetical protein
MTFRQLIWAFFFLRRRSVWMKERLDINPALRKSR